MIPAYDETYLPDAKERLGSMLDYAVNSCGLSLQEFYQRFTAGTVSRSFGQGHPRYLAGMSGSDLAVLVMEESGAQGPFPPFRDHGYTPEYWAGWALAQLQWQSGYSFETLQRYGMPIQEVVALYPTLHEADIQKFIEIALQCLHLPESPLRELRKAVGLSQEALARRSGVSLRMIRAYEQGSQSISRAEAGTVLRLASTLHCDVERLVAGAGR